MRPFFPPCVYGSGSVVSPLRAGGPAQMDSSPSPHAAMKQIGTDGPCGTDDTVPTPMTCPARSQLRPALPRAGWCSNHHHRRCVMANIVFGIGRAGRWRLAFPDPPWPPRSKPAEIRAMRAVAKGLVSRGPRLTPCPGSGAIPDSSRPHPHDRPRSEGIANDGRGPHPGKNRVVLGFSRGCLSITAGPLMMATMPSPRAPYTTIRALRGG